MVLLGMEATLERPTDGSARPRVTPESLFDDHFRSLSGLAYVILGDASAAEESVMDAFARVFARWQSVERLDWPLGYLRKAVVNQCRSRLRRARIEQRANSVFHARATREAQDQQHELRLDLWAAVKTLPPRQRMCVVLRYLEDLPEREIADLLDCSVGTVKSQLAKARSKLAVALQGDGSDG